MKLKSQPELADQAATRRRPIGYFPSQFLGRGLALIIRHQSSWMRTSILDLREGNLCTMMIAVSSEQSRSQFYMRTECCRCRCCCCCCCCLLLLLFVIVCWKAKFDAGSLNLIPVFLCLCWNEIYFWMHPLVVLLGRVYGLDLPTCSVVTGQGGCQPAAAKPPLYIYTYNTGTEY